MKPNFDIHIVLQRIENAVQPFPKAALFELYERGYTSLYEQLLACIISIRTYDETTTPVAEALFAVARTPEAISQLSDDQLFTLIQKSTFPEQKVQNIKLLTQQILNEYNGETPADFDQLTAFRGVGPKCANLALGIATGQASISVDVHVHHVTNRWGYLATKQPEQTMRVLQDILPKDYWITINRLLVPFGKHICTGNLPKCSTCPVLEFCERVGVTNSR
ncbi:MAG: endonuclease III domain-containing protein [Saprospiraceae bacterium]